MNDRREGNTEKDVEKEARGGKGKKKIHIKKMPLHFSPMT